MKKIVFVFVFVTLLRNMTYAGSLQLVPQDTVVILQIKNISKFFETKEKLNWKKFSVLKPALQSLSEKKIEKKEDLIELGINIDEDLSIIIPANSKKSFMDQQIICSINNKEKFLNNLKKRYPVQKEIAINYDGAKLYLFEELKKATQHILIIDNYVAFIDDEISAKNIAECYHDKSKRFESNEKFTNINNSLRNNNITLYINMEEVTQTLLPTFQMVGTMYASKFISDSNDKKTPDDFQKKQQMTNYFMQFSVWFLLQLDSAGVSFDLNNNEILFDYYIGFKKDSPVQEYITSKKNTLNNLDYLPDNSFFVSTSKINSDLMRKLAYELFNKMDSTLFISNDKTNLKESFLKEIDFNNSFLGDERSSSVLFNDSSLIQSVDIIDIKDANKAEQSIQKNLSLENSFAILFEKISKNKIASENILKINEVKSEEYKGIKIKYLTVNKEYFDKLPSNEIAKNLSSSMKNQFIWFTTINNKMIISFSNTDNLIKETIDKFLEPEKKSVNLKQIIVKKMPVESVESASYISILKILTGWKNTILPLDQKNGSSAKSVPKEKFDTTLSTMIANLKNKNESILLYSKGQNYGYSGYINISKDATDAIMTIFEYSLKQNISNNKK